MMNDEWIVDDGKEFQFIKNTTEIVWGGSDTCQGKTLTIGVFLN